MRRCTKKVFQDTTGGSATYLGRLLAPRQRHVALQQLVHQQGGGGGGQVGGVRVLQAQAVQHAAEGQRQDAVLRVALHLDGGGQHLLRQAVRPAGI